MRVKTKLTDVLATLILAVLFIVGGIIMLVKDLVAVGINRALQFSAVGGYLLILVGLVFLLVTYFSLSPFSKIRQFFEGGIKGKK